MNSVSIMGRITHSIELKAMSTGKSIVNFNIAVNRPFQREKTDFFRVVAFDKTADIINMYFGKGQLIAIEGRLQADTYTDRNGVKKEKVEIIADRVSFCGDNPKKESNAAENSGANRIMIRSNVDPLATDVYQEEIIDDTDDLPF